MRDMYIMTGLLIFIAIIGYAIELRKPDSNLKSIRNLLLCQLFAAAIFATYSNISAYSSGKIQGQIKDTVNITAQLSRQIERLQNINNIIGNSTNDLANKIDNLATESKKIIERINLKTSQLYEESALAGILKLPLGNSLRPTDWLSIKFGSYTGANTVYQLKTWKPPPTPILIGTEAPIKWRLENNTLLISLTVYDPYANWMVDIVDNNWHRNPNFTGKFNYDTRGFEIVDNQNNIALNLNIINNQKIEIQGYLTIPNHRKIFLAGSKGFMFLDMPSSIQSELDFNRSLLSAGVVQLFRYTGEDWLHSRLNY